MSEIESFTDQAPEMLLSKPLGKCTARPGATLVSIASLKFKERRNRKMRLSVVSIITAISLCISIIGNAGEIKEIQISPKIKIIREEEGKGVNLRHQNKNIQFLDDKGNPKKEIEFSDNPMAKVCVSSNAKRVAANSNVRWRYSDKEREGIDKARREARKQGKIMERPKDYWGVLQNVDIYDNNGEKKHSIQIDIDIEHLYCADAGEAVIYGRTRVDMTGDRLGMAKLLFYDSDGNLVRSIDGKEAIENKIAIKGSGKIYQDNKIIWVGEVGAPRDGSAVILFDLRGNIIWQYNDRLLSTNWPDISISQDNKRIYIKGRYTDWDSKEEPTKKMWVLDQNGKLLNLLDGWEHKVD